MLVYEVSDVGMGTKQNIPDTSLLIVNELLNFFLTFSFEQTGAVALLLLLGVALLCAYELCAVYVTAGAHASQQYSPSGFFFGVSAIALAINMLFICRMVFNGKVYPVLNQHAIAVYSTLSVYLILCISSKQIFRIY